MTAPGVDDAFRAKPYELFVSAGYRTFSPRSVANGMLGRVDRVATIGCLCIGYPLADDATRERARAGREQGSPTADCIVRR